MEEEKVRRLNVPVDLRTGSSTISWKRSSPCTFAAAGLVMIMIGATILTVVRQGVAPSLFPLVVGILLAIVIGRHIRNGAGRAVLGGVQTGAR